ncbi:MAG: methyltransferase domain-containing protein [Acidisphaera sp.]|nr:methyltransferase domain-containing protein [Acidisphaera sp.]
MIDLSRRSTQPELMDTEPVEAEDFRRCLADLAAVNRLTLAHRPTFAWLNRMTAGLPRGTRLSLLDVGYGYGDMLRAIRRWGERRGLRLALSGVDLNPWSALAAAGATPEDMDIRYHTGDVFAFRPEGHYDFIISALFTHHLSDPELERFLRWMERHAERGWFVNDLHRHAVALHGFRALAWAARWHRFVRHDGPLSIARAFRRADWRARLAAAGVTQARVSWHMPFRLCVERRK